MKVRPHPGLGGRMQLAALWFLIGMAFLFFPQWFVSLLFGLLLFGGIYVEWREEQSK